MTGRFSAGGGLSPAGIFTFGIGVLTVVSVASIEKPELLPVIAENIPAELKEHDHWLLWKWKDEKDRKGGVKWTKIPLAVSGGPGKSNDPSTWCSFEAAWKAYVEEGHDGIGFVFTNSPFSGVDFDDCLDDDYQLKEGHIAGVGLEVLDSYTEVSPSRTGLKVIVRGSKPKGRCSNAELGIEMYESGRYFTITGHRFEQTEPAVRRRTAEMQLLHDMVFASAGERETKREYDDREMAVMALKAINTSRGADYEFWLSVGMALHNVDRSLLSDWEGWSAAAPKYEEGKCQQKWKSFSAGPGGVGIGSLIYWAKQDGWIPPSRGGGNRASWSSLMGSAKKAAGDLGSVDDPEVQQAIRDRVAKKNQKLDEPLSDKEVSKVCDEAIRQVRQDREQTVSGYTELGLKYDAGEWWPGQWKAVMYDGQEPFCKLSVPFCERPVMIPMEEFRSPTRVAERIQAMTRRVVDDVPGRWETIWRGNRGTKEHPASPGIMPKLMHAAEWVDATRELDRKYILADFVAEWVGSRTLDHVVNEKEVEPSCEAALLDDGGVLISFSRLLEHSLASKFGATRNELSQFLRDMKAAEHWSKSARKRFFRLTREQWKSINGQESDQ